MATREERAAAIKWAAATVRSWPKYMHAQSCRCVKCRPSSPTTENTMNTHTKTYTRVTFANPYLRCDECGEPVPAMRSDTNTNLPCGHVGVTSDRPWSPVDPTTENTE